MEYRKQRIPLMIVLTCAACVRQPVTAPRAVVPETTPSEIRIAASPGKDFGHMVALGVGVSSGAGIGVAVGAAGGYFESKEQDRAGDHRPGHQPGEGSQRPDGRDAVARELEHAS